MNLSKVNNASFQKVILFLTANPEGTGKLRLAEEIRDVTERLNLSKHGKCFQIQSIGAARYDDVRGAILKYEPHIVHFSGHGHVDGTLALEDKNRQPELISPKTLSALFALFSRHVECVILNACYSEIQAKAIAEHIDYVIGMDKEIADLVAIEFAVGFYDAIGYGRSIEDAYKFGCNAVQRTETKQDLIALYNEKKYIPSSLQENSCRSPENVPKIEELSSQFISRSATQIVSEIDYEFIIGGSIKSINKKKLEAIVAHLKKISGDASLTLLDIEEGSIKLILRGSRIGFQQLESLIDSGELTEILGETVQGINKIKESHIVSDSKPTLLLSEATQKSSQKTNPDLAFKQTNSAVQTFNDKRVAYSVPLTTLEEAVMLSMQTQPRYGLEICDMVSSASGESQIINIGTLYPLLKRLTQRGLLAHVSKSEDSKIRRSHKRKYYELTSLGQKALVRAEQLRKNLRDLDEGDLLGEFQRSPT